MELVRRTEQKGPQELATTLRLLPLVSPEGKPCYLLPADGGGYLSRLADAAEVRQLEAGGDVLARARRVLDDPMSAHAEVRYAGIRLAECLSDALRIAESRGLRLPASGAGAEAAGHE